jgi:hypothetical protein
MTPPKSSNFVRIKINKSEVDEIPDKNSKGL